MAQGFFQGGGNVVNSRFRPLPHMAAGVEIVEVAGQRRHPAQIVLQHLRRKRAGFGIGGAQVHGVGPVGHQLSEVFTLQHLHSFRRVGGILFFRLAAPGIPGEEGEGIGPNGHGRLHHSHIPAAGRQMTSKITHGLHSFGAHYSTFPEKMQIDPCPERQM